MKKIIIDAYQDSNFITGTDRMAYNFLRGLQKIDKVNRYYVICSTRDYIPAAITNKNFKVIKPPRISFSANLEKISSRVWRQFIIHFLTVLQCDVFYSFRNMFLPRFRVAKKMIASNLDLIPIVLSEYKDIGRLNSEQLRKRWLKVATCADAFMSISQYSKHELCQVLHVQPEKVTVIYLAVDPLFGSNSNKVMPVHNRYKNFLLTIGGSEPRKNASLVVKAFALLPEELQKKHPLLIIGGEWQGRSLEHLQQNQYIHTLGFVSDEALAVLYKQAIVFIFASKYEGFGFTVLEAMASKVPVLSANSSSLQEIVRDNAIMFDPNDSAELASKIANLLTDQEFRNEAIKKGQEIVRNFSWENSSTQLYELLTN
jgi:glycosyltransferase involved in cell wall biosynthesis